MENNEIDDFAKLFMTVSDYYGKDKSRDAMMIYWNALKPYAFEIIKEIMSEHIKTSHFMPMVANILDVLKISDGRPDPNEAWAMVAKCLKDESITVIWTEEMANAFGIAIKLNHDSVAARMAFIETYKSNVEKARRHGAQPLWTVSLGHDQWGREEPIIEAMKLGRISHEFVQNMFPDSKIPKIEKSKQITFQRDTKQRFVI